MPPVVTQTVCVPLRTGCTVPGTISAAALTGLRESGPAVCAIQVSVRAAYAAAHGVATRDAFHLFPGQHVFNIAQFKSWFFHKK